MEISMEINTSEVNNLRDANFPVDPEGRVYHLSLKPGELANRVVCVGDPHRALLLSTFLDKIIFSKASNRGFTVFTGFYCGVPVSIVSIGMGLAMMDFFIREGRHIVDGPMCVIRLGTCGTPTKDIELGTIVVADRSVCIQTDYDATNGVAFRFSKPIDGDPMICNELYESCKLTVKGHKVLKKMDATADFFYSTQGRTDVNFLDKNEKLLDKMLEKYPDLGSLQMETFHLFYLASICTKKIHTGACAIVLGQRISGGMLNNDAKHELEKMAGKGCLETLKNWKVDSQTLMKGDHCVWEQSKS
jgi:uridine phosphorylase